MLRTAAITIVALALLGGCRSAYRAGDDAPPPRPALINHIVFFDLVNPDDAAELIRDCDERLATIPGVVSYYCGTHIDTGREAVLADYDVGFYIGFDSLEDYAAYVDHPEHIAVVTKWRPRFESITVRDVLDETE